MNTADGVELAARVIGALVVVLVLVAVAARIARRTTRLGSGRDIEVLERLALTRESQVVVVRAGQGRLLLGVGPQGVTLLRDLDRTPHPDAARLVPEVDPPAATGPAVSGPAAAGRGRHAAPAPVVATVETAPLPEQAPPPEATPLPDALPLADFPDLASALRAAGRTLEDPETGLGSASWIPAQRGTPSPDLRQATSSAPLPLGEQNDSQRENGQARARGRSAPRHPAQQRSSVLSAGTWRQGLEALRELTVRRG